MATVGVLPVIALHSFLVDGLLLSQHVVDPEDDLLVVQVEYLLAVVDEARLVDIRSSRVVVHSLGNVSQKVEETVDPEEVGISKLVPYQSEVK